jgi:hypothetical protein
MPFRASASRPPRSSFASSAADMLQDQPGIESVDA